ncbi:bifunctional folylpolyglutamate synthase/dihydrofolate synthase [Candidatus Methylacidithermus pantelleriae]|uniref:Dihydrofolate synthase/folylpolyglutamate synthase n=1 Tax=Candidatus Methylacidithermus pantelleriae TaxID=2744239 RepID=A0A8J2BRW8_9BACT|nr:folylpolyglutamate synthase/dihydrofolate synthase family protein [Candidatus Methylacidithermus pantelleriae]CAF0702565.1 Dihydrofolate synthase [Candidatus Methylacidithermus pantelleriae]
MDYLEALRILGSVRKGGAKFGLTNMQRLVRRLGNPQDCLRFIHIAGTNGKGSTAAFLASVLQRAGFRVGLYTSPHLCSIRERIQINFSKISEERFAALVEEVLRAAQAREDEDGLIEPTFFEILTAVSLLYFAEERVDWVVWETGLGGRLDATNVVVPVACVITQIDFDHQAYLGHTLAEIAREKAGILKEGIPTVVAVEREEARRVVKKRANQLGATFIPIEEEVPWKLLQVNLRNQEARIGKQSYTLGLVGEHQVRNAACVVALCQRGIFGPASLLDRALKEGLQQLPWPGRFQVLQENPPFVVDGAHNPAAARTVRATWQAVFGSIPYHLCIGVVADKDASGIAQELESGAFRVTVVKPPTERGMEPHLLAKHFPSVPVEVAESWGGVAVKLFERNREPVLLTGSFYLVGEVLADFYGWEKEFSWNELLSPPQR